MGYLRSSHVHYDDSELFFESSCLRDNSLVNRQLQNETKSRLRIAIVLAFDSKINGSAIRKTIIFDSVGMHLLNRNNSVHLHSR